jgi:hypothetical protein
LTGACLDIGARLSQRSGMLGEYVLSCVSLMGGYRSAAANKPIAFTGQLEYMAPRRLAETAKFGFDVTRTGAMAVGADWVSVGPESAHDACARAANARPLGEMAACRMGFAYQPGGSHSDQRTFFRSVSWGPQGSGVADFR